jgi:hypothetical protein
LIEDSPFEALLDYVPTVQDEMAVPTFPEVDATRVAPMRLASARDAIRPPIPASQADARQSCHANALCPHPPAANVAITGGNGAQRNSRPSAWHC